MRILNNITKYINCLDDIEKFKSLINENTNNPYFLLIKIFYYESLFKNNDDTVNSILNFVVIKEDEIINIINYRIDNYSYSANKVFIEDNYFLLNGLITYYNHKYNLYISSIIIIFILTFSPDKYQNIKQHISFLLLQKRTDGLIGYINPLQNYKNLNHDLFYTINSYCYETIKKFITLKKEVFYE